MAVGVPPDREAGDASDPGTTATFRVARLDGTEGYLGTDPATGRRFMTLYASRGNIVVLVVVVGKARMDRAAAEALLRTQVALLPG